jgi:hypothetical protein
LIKVSLRKGTNKIDAEGGRIIKMYYYANKELYIIIIRDLLIWVTGHCNRAAVSRNRYGVEKTVDTHKILINAIKCCLSSRNMIDKTMWEVL